MVKASCDLCQHAKISRLFWLNTARLEHVLTSKIRICNLSILLGACGGVTEALIRFFAIPLPSSKRGGSPQLPEHFLGPIFRVESIDSHTAKT